MRPRRPHILGFGPIGYALLVPLGALVWVAWTGYDLRYDLLRLIDGTLGSEALYTFVSYGITGHYLALYSPHLCLTSLALALLILHFAPHPPGGSRYAILILWSLLEPALFLLMQRWWTGTGMPRWMSRRPVFPWIGNNWELIVLLATGAAMALCLWYLTRCRAVALAILVAFLVLYPASENALAQAVPPRGHFGALLWHMTFAVILISWVVREMWRIKPDYACQSCGYDLRGLSPPVCPECGAPAPSPTPAS